MEHIRAIQETIDESKESMPTGTVTTLMQEVQGLYPYLRWLYHVQMTTVGWSMDDGDVSLEDETSITIAEAVSDAPTRLEDFARTLRMSSRFHESYLTKPMPFVVNSGTRVTIIHSITPFVPKRRREEH